MSLWGSGYSVGFPNIGIEISDLPRGVEVFGFKIAFYGIIIAIGMLCGIAIARWQAKRSKQNPDFYFDFAIIAIPVSVIGARLYSVAFEWDYYKDNLLNIFNLRNGGLAIYGGVIAAIICAFTYCKVKKYSFGLFTDTGILGLILGQIIGRWGNFFNREAFGKYTNSLLAMKIDVADPSLGSVFKPSIYSDTALASLYQGKERALANIMEIRNNIITGADGHSYVLVQPTFLYESLWNLALLIVMIKVWPKKKFNGEILLMYLSGYGLGRFIIEGFRTDQLFLWNTGIAVSQLLSGILFVVATGLIIFLRHSAIKNGTALVAELNTVEVAEYRGPAVAENSVATASTVAEENEKVLKTEESEKIDEVNTASEAEKAEKLKETIKDSKTIETGKDERVEEVEETNKVSEREDTK